MVPTKFCAELNRGMPMESVSDCTMVMVVMKFDACAGSVHCGASGE
jgi:hypothetical protein